MIIFLLLGDGCCGTKSTRFIKSSSWFVWTVFVPKTGSGRNAKPSSNRSYQEPVFWIHHACFGRWTMDRDEASNCKSHVNLWSWGDSPWFTLNSGWSFWSSFDWLIFNPFILKTSPKCEVYRCRDREICGCSEAVIPIELKEYVDFVGGFELPPQVYIVKITLELESQILTVQWGHFYTESQMFRHCL